MHTPTDLIEDKIQFKMENIILVSGLILWFTWLFRKPMSFNAKFNNVIGVLLGIWFIWVSSPQDLMSQTHDDKWGLLVSILALLLGLFIVIDNLRKFARFRKN